MELKIACICRWLLRTSFFKSLQIKKSWNTIKPSNSKKLGTIFLLNIFVFKMIFNWPDNLMWIALRNSLICDKFSEYINKYLMHMCFKYFIFNLLNKCWLSVQILFLSKMDNHWINAILLFHVRWRQEKIRG